MRFLLTSAPITATATTSNTNVKTPISSSNPTFEPPLNDAVLDEIAELVALAADVLLVEAVRVAVVLDVVAKEEDVVEICACSFTTIRENEPCPALLFASPEYDAMITDVTLDEDVSK